MRRERRDWMRLRLFLILIGFLLYFCVIIGQAFRLQILHGEELRKRAQRQYNRRVQLPPARGTIYDRNGGELAISIEMDSIFAQPTRIKDPARTAEVLSPVLGMKKGELLRRLREERHFVWLKRHVPPSVTSHIQGLGIRGIGSVKETKRFYPNVELAAQVIGFSDIDGKGLEGLEYIYDHLLRGKPVNIIVEQDAMGRPLDTKIIQPSGRGGAHLVLTLHKTIQSITEEKLKEGVLRSRATSGMAIVMDPRTGEILAMANYPYYNPNTFWNYKPHQWRNRCVTDRIEPGSILKVFIVASALEEGVIRPNDIFFCENGKFRIYDRVIHDTKRHGWLSVKGILQYSSNIGAAKIGLELGPSRLYRHLKAFGFGRATGIDLPGETKGFLRPPNLWTPVDLASISFGQGISVSAIQLVTAYSALANGGLLMRPYVVKEVLSPEGRLLEERHPEVMGRAVSSSTALLITRMLISAVEKGTGRQAHLDGFLVAGKTGTAQKPDLVNGANKDDRYFASFVGYLPADDPRLCILVIIDEPAGEVYGGIVAAPIFREIARASLPFVNVFPKRTLVARARG